MDLMRTPAKRRVHIVDDDSEVREALALLLSTARIESHCHGSAEAFLETVPLGASACVVLDNRLPGLSGVELLTRIVGSSSDMAVIMMTGHGDVPTAVTAMKLGAFHFVEKPFDAEVLLDIVEQALSRAEEVQDLHAERNEYKARLACLTQREEAVFDLMVAGLQTKAVANRLGITARTAEHHRAAVIRKLQAQSFAHLLRMAIKFGDPFPRAR